MVRKLASGPSCPGFNSQHSPKNVIGKSVNVANVNQWHCLKESGQWLEKVDQTRLVLISGKIVLQKDVEQAGGVGKNWLR